MVQEAKPIIALASEDANSDSTKQANEFNLRSILTILGAGLAVFCTVGFQNSFGVFLDYYHRDLLPDKSSFDLSWIGSFSAFILFLFAAPAGLLVDRVGPTILLVIGATITVFSMFMLSLCREYYQFFLAQGFLLAVGQAFLTFPAIAMISHHFNKNRGLATGFTIAGSSLGGVIWPIVANQLLSKDGVSFGWTIRIMAFTMLPLVIIACVTVLPPKQVEHKVEEATPPEPKEEPKKKMDLSIFKHPVFLTYCGGVGLFSLGMFTPLFFITSYAVSLGTSTSFAFYLVSILNAASLFGRISAGWLADRYGHFNLCSICALLSALIAFCWTAATSSAGLVVWGLAYGYCSGTILALQISCATKLATPKTYGTTVGMVLAVISLTGLFGTPISGELIKTGYLALSMYIGAVLVAGGLLVCAARFQLSRKLMAVV